TKTKRCNGSPWSSLFSGLRRRTAATRLAATCVRLGTAKERTRELAFHFGSHRIHIDACLGQKMTRIFHVVGSSRLNAHLHEACIRQLRSIVPLFQSTPDASHPKQHALTHPVRNAPTDHHILNRKPAARLQNAIGFPHSE